MESIQSLVNENKLYSVIGKFFTNRNSLLLELIQNACRAKAKNVNVQIPYRGEHFFHGVVEKDNLIHIQDDGYGISDIVALLGIAISDWDDSVVEQDPAGMGFLQLVALSKQISIKSKFGHLVFNSKRFLNDPAYRKTILGSVDSDESIEKGTLIIAEMQQSSQNYLQRNLMWYRGYKEINLKINTELLTPLTLTELEDSATERKNIYRVSSYLNNDLFVEIGRANSIVDYSHSVVNWYGQLISIPFPAGLASCNHIRFYYEVRNGTPLSPTYPDRNNVVNNDNYAQFILRINDIAQELLMSYFKDYPENSTFPDYVNHSLLSSLYEFGDKDKVAKLNYIPAWDNGFQEHDFKFNDLIIPKSKLLSEELYFHNGFLAIDDEYKLGTSDEGFKCITVSDKVASHLRQLQIREIDNIQTVSPLNKLINLESLKLRLCFKDKTSEVTEVNNVLLLGDYDNAFIFTLNKDSVLSVLDEHLENIYDTSLDYTLSELERDIKDSIKEELINSHGQINLNMFGFLPNHDSIKSINFEDGNLAIDYFDGNCNNLEIQR